MKVNRLVLYFLFLSMLSVVFIYYKKQLEHFKELVIQTSSDIGITRTINEVDPSSLNSYRFNRICVGNTCMDGNVIASTLDLFRKNDTKLRTISTCSDNVCIFSDHLKMFNNSNDSEQPGIVNRSDVNDVSKVNPYGNKFSWKGRGIMNDGFRLSLGGSTDEVLKGLGTDIYNVGEKQFKRRPEVNPKPFVTRMIPGRICYSPNTTIPYQVTFQDTSTLSPYIISNLIAHKHFQYFDYDDDANQSSLLGTRGKTGVKDYTYCYSDRTKGDSQYIPNDIVAGPLLSNSDDVLKKNNMVASNKLPKPFSLNIPAFGTKFQFGKPYDKVTVLPSTVTTEQSLPTVSTTKPANSYLTGTNFPVGG